MQHLFGGAWFVVLSLLVIRFGKSSDFQSFDTKSASSIGRRTKYIDFVNQGRAARRQSDFFKVSESLHLYFFKNLFE